MSNKLNPFEKQLKDAAERHTISYDVNQWNELEGKLNTNKTFNFSWQNSVLSAFVILLVGYGVFYFIKDENPVQNIETKEIIIENKKEKPEPEAPEVVERNIKIENVNKRIPVTSKKRKEYNLEEKEILSIKPQKDEVNVIEEEIIYVDVEKKITEEKIEIPVVVLNFTEICAGVEFTLILNDETLENVVWHLGNGDISKSKVLKYVYLESGIYNVKAYIPDLDMYTASKEIIVNPKPDASFSVNENIENEMIPVVHFLANTGGEKSYSWNLGDGTVFNEDHVSYTYRKAGDYEVSLSVSNKYECFGRNAQRITIEKEFKLLAPNSFSPNGDGINDFWFPVALTSGRYNFELRVFDRNSNLIFESTDSEVKFDGKSHGKMAPSGEIFIWKAITTDQNGVRQEYGGTVISMY